MSLLNSAEKSMTRQRITSPNVLQYANEKRNKGTFNDVTIEADTETIAANRMILSCCSRFFEGMFNLEMKEKYQHDPVQINGFDGKAVKVVIDFMYSGEVTIKNENVMDLLAASDYLQMGEVKEFCFEFLESILSPANWFAIRSAADLYQNKHLENQVCEYMSTNFDIIIQTDEFKSLDKDGVRSCIKKLNRRYATEESIFNGLVVWSLGNEYGGKNDFPDLFEQLIRLDGMSLEVLEETVLKEDLVKRSSQCLNVVTKSLCHRSKGFGSNTLISLGGRKAQGKCFEVYNCSNKPSKEYSDLPHPLYGHCSLPSKNFVYCIGGLVDSDNGNLTVQINVWRFNINDKNSKWEKVAPLKQKRCLMGGAVFHESLVVAGGWNQKDMASVEFYQGAVNEWKISSSLKQPRSCCALAASEQYLYVLGGMDDEKCLSSVERTANLKEQWEQIQPMQMPRKWFSAVSCNEAVYAIGGTSDKGKPTNTVEKYDLADDKWSYVNSMITERSSHAACVVNGKIFVVGGNNEFGEAVNTIECYNSLTDSWTVVGETDVNLIHHAIVPL